MQVGDGHIFQVYKIWTACLCVVHYTTGIGPEKLLPFSRCKSFHPKKVLCNLWLLFMPRWDIETALDWLCLRAGTTPKTVQRNISRTQGPPSSTGYSELLFLLSRLTQPDVLAAIEAGWFGSGRRSARPWREGALLLEKTRGWLQAEFPQGPGPAP